MRLLRVIRSLAPHTGGPAESVTRVSAAMLEQGHSVEIATLDAPGEPWLKSPAVPVRAFGPAAGNYGRAPAFEAWLGRNAAKFDAVVVSGLWQYQSAAVSRVLTRFPRPYFVFPHGMLDPWFRRAHPLKHAKKLAYWLLVERRVLRCAAAVLFTCEEERRLARDTFPGYQCREAVVSYGASVPEPAAEREQFLARFPECRDRRLILFLGRLHPKKGCDLLVSAFRNFHARHGDAWRLVLAGPDSANTRAQLESLGKGLPITYTGLVQDELKWGAFRAAELFALPSHQENFGIAIAEALGCGLPVVTTRGVNIWREIETDQAGYICEPDIAQLTDRLNTWAALPDSARAEASARARACFLRRFEITGAARSLAETIQQTLAR